VHCRELGTALARLHLAGKNFEMRRPNNLSVADWGSLLAASGLQANDIYHGLFNLLNDELRYLTQAWPSGLPEGVIHADLFPDNVFFLGDTLSGLIDFYFACTDALAYDLAICLNAWCFEADGSFNITKSQQMVTAYEKVRPLSAAERAAIPVLARGAALRFLLTRLYDWLNHPKEALVKPKDPLEYLSKLRFHQQLSGIAGYGL
jgi:homoserine kinase type II